MKKEEYLEELMKDKNFESTLNISANINAIVVILLKNNLTTQEEYEKLVNKSEVKLQELIVKLLSKQAKEDLETGKFAYRFIFPRLMKSMPIRDYRVKEYREYIKESL